MSITTEDVNETRIVWTTNLNCARERKTEIVRLNHSQKCSSYFVVSCTSRVPKERSQHFLHQVLTDLGHMDVQSNAIKLQIELSLMPVEDMSGREPRRNSEERDVALGYYSRPSVVWASVNNGEKFPLKVSADSDEYKSGKIFLINIRRHGAQSSTFEFWINFPNFDRGEKNLLKDLTALFVQQSNCDIHFFFEGKNEQHKLGAHVNILTARSSVFAAMFQHNMKETLTGKVYIQDVPYNIFTELLHYIYSGRTKTEMNEDTAQPLYIASDKYDIEDLKKDCVHFLVSSFTVENILHLLVWAHLHLVDELKTKAFKFIAKHGKAVCQLDDWETFIKQYPDLSCLASRHMMGIM